MRVFAIVSVLLACTCAAAAQDNKWRFDVTPGATPRLKISLLPKRQLREVGLTLSHGLEFDGLEYRSSLRIAELSSRFFRVGPNYRWTRVDGVVVVIPGAVASLPKWVTPATTRWGDGFEVADETSDTKYVYARGLLRAIVSRAESREYLYDDDDRLSRLIVEYADNREELLVHYQPESGVQEIVSGERKIQLKYDGDDLVRCSVEGGTAFDFEYENGLLRKVAERGGGVIYSYTWGLPQRSVRFSSGMLPRPVVVSDGKFNYQVTEGMMDVTVRFQALEGPAEGEWNWSQRKRAITRFLERK